MRVRIEQAAKCALLHLAGHCIIEIDASTLRCVMAVTK